MVRSKGRAGQDKTGPDRIIWLNQVAFGNKVILRDLMIFFGSVLAS
jgi:hypothetical protein